MYILYTYYTYHFYNFVLFRNCVNSDVVRGDLVIAVPNADDNVHGADDDDDQWNEETSNKQKHVVGSILEKIKIDEL